MNCLSSWCLEGLDVEKAIAQPETAYKVRHIKMGIRLAGALCMCDDQVTLNLMVSKLNIVKLLCKFLNGSQTSIHTRTSFGNEG